MAGHNIRKLATIRTISNIYPIPGADAIDVATVDGWKVVVRKGEFSIGEQVIYIEIDSWVPTKIAPFLSKGKAPKVFNDVKGEKLRTIRLRGQVSQGLILPYRILTEPLNDDLTAQLGIQKWEAPIPAQLAGRIIGGFPAAIPKTDEERIQNLTNEFKGWQEQGLSFEVTEKLNGSSMTVFLHDGVFGVCSRNFNLAQDETNTFWRVAIAQGLQGKLERIGYNLALQGELIGNGVQGNSYNLEQQFIVFTIYNISEGRYLTPKERVELCSQYTLSHVPVLASNHCIDGYSLETLLEKSQGTSALNCAIEREGVVFKCCDNPSIHFKVISTRFLLSEK